MLILATMMKGIEQLSRLGSRYRAMHRSLTASGTSPCTDGHEGFHGLCRTELLAFLLEQAEGKSDYLVLDCGSHKGQYMPGFLKKGATVIAFEPNPHAAAFVQERLGGKANFHLEQSAVSTENGTKRLHFRHNAAEDPVHWARSSSLLSDKENVSAEDYIAVNAIDLSEYILKMDQRVNFLKLDIEGEEVAVINHLIDSGAIDRVDFLAAELHENSTRTPMSFWCAPPQNFGSAFSILVWTPR